MGLIARELEAAGIATVSLSSALSITRSVNPPRAAFLDFPLGQTAGPADRPEVQLDVVREALRCVVDLREPGALKWLAHTFAGNDDWKRAVLTAAAEGEDERVERHASPQYQLPEDEVAAAAAPCPGCIFLDERSPSG